MSISNKYSLLIFAVLLLLLLSWKSLVSYLDLSFSISNAWMLLLPFTVYVRSYGEKSSKYFVPALLFLLLHYFLPSPFFILMSVCFSAFWLVEEFIGKLNKMAPLVIIMVTPLTEYFFNVFGFPVRLKLTELATSLLQTFHLNISHNGNQIEFNREVFSVDPECMGLNMVITSFLLAVLILSGLEQKFKKQVSFIKGILYLVVSLVLVVFTNLVRIVLLILFHSAPDSMSHQLIGVLCLLMLTALPLFVVAYFLVKKSGNQKASEKKEGITTRKKLFLYFVLFKGLGISQLQVAEYVDIPNDQAVNAIELNGFDKEVLLNNILKLQNENSIIYIKPSKGIFRSNHNPKVCWKGSGYTFKKEQEKKLGEYSVYKAELHREEDILYTAWWYDNGKQKTNSQLGWRWASIRGEGNFRMVNVTSSSEKELEKSIMHLLNKNLFAEPTEKTAALNTKIK